MQSIAIGGNSSCADLAVWPVQQRVEPLPGAPQFAVARFADASVYHPALLATVLDLARDPANVVVQDRAIGGRKVYDLHRRAGAELAFICARAMAFFKQIWRSDAAVIDMSWANVYGEGDYSLAHSHLRAAASVVYCLDPGDPDGEDAWAGQFCFVDPRLAACCQGERGCVTNPLMPGLAAGTMLIFPGQAVHCVNPYRGRRPRVTLAWNINATALPGEPTVPYPRQPGGS